MHWLTFSLVLLGTAGSIAGGLVHNTWLLLVFKPLTMLVVIAWAGSTLRARKNRLHAGIFAGLLCSVIGDIVLIWPDRFFILGLCAFLCAHIAYIAAFSHGAALPLKPAVRLPFIAFAMAMWAVLHQNLNTVLRFAVAVYAIVLVSMASQTWIWHHRMKSKYSPYAVVGSALFVASDTLLAINRFHTPIAYPSLWILATYFLAQWCITASVAEPSRPAQ